MPEIWKSVVGYEGLYEVSDQGQVRSLTRNGRRGKILRPGFGSVRKGCEYKRQLVILSVSGKHKTKTVHRLVLEAFVGPRPEGMEGCHNDGNTQNNKLENLRWDTRKNNHADSVKHGTHSPPPKNTVRDKKGRFVGNGR